VFHISPSRNRSSIETVGLPQSDVDHIHVWLLKDQAKAEELSHLSWGGSRQNDIWTVDVTGYEIISDPHPGGQAYGFNQSWEVTHPIPFSRLSRLTALSKPTLSRSL
jgi:hypothetical protein